MTVTLIRSGGCSIAAEFIPGDDLMARKTKADAEQTRQDILDAALELFHAKGYSRTTLEDIALSAGVTRGAIYWHFKDKIDLFMGIKEEVERSTETRLEDLLLLSVTNLSDMRDNLLRLFLNLERDERFRRYFELVFFRIEFTEELQPVMEQFKEKCCRMQQKDKEDLVRLQQEDKLSADLDCKQAALGFRCLILGIIHSWLIDESLFSLADQGSALVDDYLQRLRLSKEKF
ncbi:MAG: TetR family transcriptional regulator [Pedobacter sp.]